MAKHPRMILYLDRVQELLKAFPTFTIQQVSGQRTHMQTHWQAKIDEDPSWQDPIIDYLTNGNLPTDKFEARKVQQKAERYYMHGNKLIHRSYSGLHLTCIKYHQTLEILCRIHGGKCGNHSGAVYHPQNSPWPFMQWAIDLVDPLPPVPAKKEMMIVPTDYFTKWIEAEALSSTKEADVERFIWRNIICRLAAHSRWLPTMANSSLASRSLLFL
ncbi:hypothetical protein L3X38_007848 [Prunus dulcis]|uniref:Transposable element protein n=1 Tax=Prunus dulcis TaxID=3755 RepID=A0AAD4ZVA5_PRUDU|nr:hypothetical protein L3X38_007848 [Prunus dulcis]